MQAAFQHLQWLDYPRLSEFVRESGELTLDQRHYPQAWPALVRVVLGQQVSTKAAQSIWNKVSAVCDDDFEGVFLDRPDALRECGLSRAKQRTLTELFQAKRDGSLDLPSLIDMEFDTRLATLTPFWGIGPWSVQMFSMFHCLDSDIWSPGDLALKKGVIGFSDGRDPDDLIQAARPYRTYLALYCWKAANANLF